MPETTTTGTKDISLTPETDIGYNAGPVKRFEANVEAVKTIKKIEAENRHATPEEQMTMARFSGWGDSDFNKAFDSYERQKNPSDSMVRRGAELQAILTKDEYQAIEDSRRTAYFTTPDIVKSMWNTLVRMGANKISHPSYLERKIKA
jgi:hypothetical protein